MLGNDEDYNEVDDETDYLPQYDDVARRNTVVFHRTEWTSNDANEQDRCAFINVAWSRSALRQHVIPHHTNMQSHHEISIRNSILLHGSRCRLSTRITIVAVPAPAVSTTPAQTRRRIAIDQNGNALIIVCRSDVHQNYKQSANHRSATDHSSLDLAVVCSCSQVRNMNYSKSVVCRVSIENGNHVRIGEIRIGRSTNDSTNCCPT
jgi:hypothetical protein